MQIDTHLAYWPKFQVHKAKQRLTKITQYLIRKRRIDLRSKTRLVGVKKKVERREQAREKKAVNAAKLESAIEKELLERLRTGAYGDIYNFAQDEYEKVLDTQMEELDEMEEEEISGDEYEAEYEEDSEDELVDDIEENGANGGAQDFDFDDEADDFDKDSDEDLETGGRSQEDMGKYVRERARKRRHSKENGPSRKGRKGRKLRDIHGGVRVEVEYEHEAAAEHDVQR